MARKPHKNAIRNEDECKVVAAFDEWMQSLDPHDQETVRLHVCNAHEKLRAAGNCSGERQAKALVAVVYEAVRKHKETR